MLGRQTRLSIVVWPVAIVTIIATSCAPRPEVDSSAHGSMYGITVEYNRAVQLKDGRVVRVNLYSPADPVSGIRAPGPFPVVIESTPYGKSTSGFNLDLVRHGYIGAVADVPGTGVSDGQFSLFDPTEATAGAELVEWAARLPGSNGRVGMIGHSYSAINQLFTAAAVGPDSPLKAIFPMSATVDPYRDLFVSGGALNVMSPLGLLFGYGITRTRTPFVEAGGDMEMALHYASENFAQMGRFEGVMAADMVDNGPRRYFDEFWAEREPAALLSKIVENRVAVYLMGGEYDVFQRGVPLLYSGLQNAEVGRDVYGPMSPGLVPSGRYQMTFGPWTHASIGAGIDMTELELRWFDRWLKDVHNGVDDTTAPIRVIEPGGGEYDTSSYPLSEAGVTRFWLSSGGALNRSGPAGPEPTDRIVYAGLGEVCSASTVQFAAGLEAEKCLKPATKPLRTESEVTYSTSALETPMRIAGPVGLSLEATSNRPESFFAVTLEDVAPDGTSMDLSGGAQLGSLRQLDAKRSWPTADGGHILPYLKLTKASSLEVPVGEVTRYDVEIRPTFATIPAGHHLRLRIATSDFPHIIPLADLGGLIFGSYQIHHDLVTPSFLDIPLIKAR